ncbi:uncharacterized protein LOC112056180 [Bicyclus anynana]|uniref:Uncharacterized protein LOC112056180 n=1 Tax=Bicyclus anynana TaxID=110368 RepID=A0A6J1P2K5_BICAN|nr:uncharacterized protein LOC112056180 [Bicyclus anynana]
MSFWYTLFVQLLFVAVLEITCSDRKIVLKSAVAKVPVTRTYAGLLNSLIKVNEDRVKTLKKLYRLNSMPYGKDSLRTTIENKMLSYDEMQERLIMAVKNCLKKSELGLTKYNRLRVLRTSSETDSIEQNQKAVRRNAQSSDSQQQPISQEMEKLIYLPNNTHKYIRTAEIVDSTYEEIEDKVKGQNLRDNKERKCIDACDEVLGKVCDKLNCMNKERRAFEKKCINACKDRF